MLNGFLKPAWQSKSTEKRRLAIVKMDASTGENQTIFAKLANEDPSTNVQLACIKKINTPSVLFELSKKGSRATHEIREAAHESLSSLIGPNGEASQEQLQNFLNQHPSSSTILIAVAPFPELRHRLVKQHDETGLANLIANVSYAETRNVIAEQLSSTDALELARKNLKGKDKKAERILRTKLESIRESQKVIETNQLAANDLLTQMEFIANHPQWRSEFKGRFELYISRWDALHDTLEKETLSQFTNSQAIAQAKVDEQIQLEHTLASQLRLVEKLEIYCCETLAPLDLESLKNEQLSINTVLADAIATWLELNKSATAEAKLSSRFLNAERALEWLSTLISDKPASAINASKWPNSYPKLAAFDEVQEHRRQQINELKTTEAANKKTLDDLHKRLNRLMGTTKQGDLRKARHELSAVTKIVEKHTGKDGPKLNERLILAQETVQKMEDWHVFATEPKLIELCELMEGLNGATLHADSVAEKIANLQTKWKELGHSEAADTHWPRFKDAADKAYEPCALFFTKRKETQKYNLQKREPLVAQMSGLLNNTNWQDQPDYRSIEHELKEIDNKWRAIKDVERHAGQRQWNKLKKIKDQVFSNLDPVYDANIGLKENLVRQLELLLTSELKEDSLDKLKLVQQRWKQVGVTRRKQDQALWKDFKHKSDAVFEKISSLRSDRRAEEDGQLKAYKDLINQIAHSAKNANSLAEADSKIEELQQQYLALPPLPKGLPEKMIERLESDYQRAQTSFSSGRDAIILKVQKAQFSQLKDKAFLCSELESAFASKNDADIQTLKDKINSIELANKEWDKELEQRVSKADNPDKTNANDQRKQLCIELEILKETDSPSEDKALRMSIQLDRMKNQGFGAAPLDKKQFLKELEVKWYLIEGADPDVQSQLNDRFEKVLSL